VRQFPTPDHQNGHRGRSPPEYHGNIFLPASTLHLPRESGKRQHRASPMLSHVARSSNLRDYEQELPFSLPGCRSLYPQVASVEAVLSLFPSRATPVTQEGASSASSEYVENTEVRHFKRFLIHLSGPLLPSTCLLARRRALSARQRQRCDPPHHAAKQTPRQMTLGQ